MINEGRVKADQWASIISLYLSAVSILAVGLAWFVRRVKRGRATSERANVEVPQRAALLQPAQLPREALWFVGRRSELSALITTGGDLESASGVVITAIDGMAGIGKTALAVHVGHRLADRYPNGQLFIDLHGFTEAMNPVHPAEALDRLLRAVGVSGEQIPDQMEDRASLWRTILAGQRMLIVLDNAVDEKQVEPLLPGAPGCLVVVTSRRRLVGLEATRIVSLDTLPPEDAVTLFARTAGQDQFTDESHEAAIEVVQLCGLLPLAIRVAAARLRVHPTWTAEDLLVRLRQQGHRLTELEAGQRSVIAALELSYKQLSFEQQHIYRLLGLHPGPDIEPYAAAALANRSLRQTMRLLDQLVGVHLLQEPAAGRYTFHDLVRAHATAVACNETKAAQRHALNRLLDFYRYAASMAVDVAYPHERDRRPRIQPANTPTSDPPDSGSANQWLDSEIRNLLSAADYSVAYGWPEHTMHLSTILRRHLRTRNLYNHADRIHSHALTTARAMGNRAGEFEALLGLAWVQQRLGRHELAIPYYESALEITSTVADQAGEMETLIGLGDAHRRQGRYERALDDYGGALQIALATDNGLAEVDARTGLGWVCLRRGHYQDATSHFECALPIARTAGYRIGELTALNGFGWGYMMQGRGDASEYLMEALSISRNTGYLAGETNALAGLGRVYLTQGTCDDAARHFRNALRIALAAGHRHGELNALNGIGHASRMRGKYKQAAEHHQQALDTARDLGSKNWQIDALYGLGHLYSATGRLDTALSCYGQMLELSAQIGRVADQARAYNGLAYTCYALNQREQARQHWQHALNILIDLGVNRTDEGRVSVTAIRAMLTSSD